MKIAIIGSGAAGSVFAAYLKKGGADDITLVDMYKAHMDKVASDGLLFHCPEGDFLLTGYKTAYNADNIGIMDIVIIMVKTTQTDSAMALAAPCIGPETVVCSLQNGLGNEEKIKKYIPADRIMVGCGNMGTELQGPGECTARPNPGENMYFGPAELSPLTEKAGKYLEKCFAEGGICPHFYEDPRERIWKKAASNSGFNTVCAVTRLKVSEVAADPNAMELVWSIWREAGAVSEAMGIPGIWEYMVEDQPKVVAGLGAYYPSMAQDFIAHRQTEVDALSGAIAFYGKKYGVPTPTCDTLTMLIKAQQANYEKQF